MIQEYNYISINEIVARIKRHPYLADISFEKVVQYVLDFFRIVGLPKMFLDKEEIVEIKDYKGLLPCDLIQIIQVRDLKSELCLRSMTDSFSPKCRHERTEFSFKTQGNILVVSFKYGKVNVAYKSLPIDNNGYPMIIDNPVFLKALENYIKKEEFIILFDTSQISQVVYETAKQNYALAIASLGSELTLPSLSEMESVSRMWNTVIQRTTDFDSGFNHLGDREHIIIHP